MKRFKNPAIILVLLMIPTLAFSADKFAPADALIGTDNTVTVPLEIGNRDGLMAIDIPLTWSDGVTLKEVTFEGTRVEYFDFKHANINNEENFVVIGLLNQITSTRKEPLAAGEGPVANLVFEIDDATISDFTLSSHRMYEPSHELMYVYNGDASSPATLFETSKPEFDRITIALSGMGPNELPIAYALEQNYPNPFNPDTEIGFALPAASQVEITVYNVLGQTVNTLVNDYMEAGTYSVRWDGTNSDGSSVSSGVYFYRIQADGFNKTKKMMLLK